MVVPWISQISNLCYVYIEIKSEWGGRERGADKERERERDVNKEKERERGECIVSIHRHIMEKRRGSLH